MNREEARRFKKAYYDFRLLFGMDECHEGDVIKQK